MPLKPHKILSLKHVPSKYIELKLIIEWALNPNPQTNKRLGIKIEPNKTSHHEPPTATTCERPVMARSGTYQRRMAQHSTIRTTKDPGSDVNHDDPSTRTKRSTMLHPRRITTRILRRRTCSTRLGSDSVQKRTDTTHRPTRHRLRRG